MNSSVRLAILCSLTFAAVASAQQTRPTTRGAGRGNRGPTVVSPEVKERAVTFRILAPNAQQVRLGTPDLPGGQNAPRTFTKGEQNVWSLTLTDVAPGTYRYTFNVDGVTVVDPRNGGTSESNGNVSSVVHVDGHAFEDALADVPHGAVAEVHYRSSTLGRMRRMHVYTPPGYEAGTEKYPVFYLLHGAGDTDDSWTSVGRANFILDNLIAQKKARPMIVVMPAGHVPQNAPGGAGMGSTAFDDDFAKDLRPYVEGHYRVLTDRNSRAIAGLSMGGAQTLSVFLANPKDYGYVGVYSSGMLFRTPQQAEERYKDMLADKAVKDGLHTLWFATGSQDFLLDRTKQTVEFFKKHEFSPVFKETAGGHTWINWRDYLNEFAPMLFANDK
jgi:enterochelin esterase-like enzyme